VIKELTTLGLAEWNKFLDEIKALDTNKLREKAETARKKKEEEKVQNARLARLETMQTDAIEVMRLQLQRTSRTKHYTAIQSSFTHSLCH
jgi:hypothetical protein